MTHHDRQKYAEVLTTILTGNELYDFLVMLADELESEEGTSLLRELALRGIWPSIGKGWYSDEYPGMPPHWTIPASLFKAMPRPTEYKEAVYFRDDQQAWAALLGALDGYSIKEKVRL